MGNMNTSLPIEKENLLHQYSLYEQRMQQEEDNCYASLPRRWMAFSVDRFILVVTLISSLWILVTVGESIGMMQHTNMYNSDVYPTIHSTNKHVWNMIFGGTFLFGLLGYPCLYYALFESSRLQATPGKLLLGLAVVDRSNNRVRFGRAFSRSIFKEISSLLMGIGFVVAAFTSNKQALHDIIAKTYVVDNKARHRMNYLQYKCEQHIHSLDT